MMAPSRRVAAFREPGCGYDVVVSSLSHFKPHIFTNTMVYSPGSGEGGVGGIAGVVVHVALINNC